MTNIVKYIKKYEICSAPIPIEQIYIYRDIKILVSELVKRITAYYIFNGFEK